MEAEQAYPTNAGAGEVVSIYDCAALDQSLYETISNLDGGWFALIGEAEREDWIDKKMSACWWGWKMKGHLAQGTSDNWK